MFLLTWFLVSLACARNAWAGDAPLPSLTANGGAQNAARPKLPLIPQLNAVQIENLAALAHVWGFLKYYDPRVVGGDVPWDQELFRVLPDVIAAKDRASSNQILFDWVSHLDRVGPIDETPPPVSPKRGLILEPDLEWLNDRDRLGEALWKRLQVIQAQPRQFKKSAFVGFEETGAPNFDREVSYAKEEFPDAADQLLALFRYWNVIEYWYPYRDVATENWSDVLKESIPRFASVNTFTDYQRELLRLAAHVHDAHAVVISAKRLLPPDGPGALPVRIRFIGREAVVDELFEASSASQPLRVGDVILSQNGRTTSALIATCAPFYAASNEAVLLRNIARNFTRGPVGPVSLKIRRAGQEESVTVQRAAAPLFPLAKEIHVLPGPGFQMLSPDVAYLKVCASALDDIRSYLRDARFTKGWILDLRGYPHDGSAYTLGTHFTMEKADYGRFGIDAATEPGAVSRGEKVSVLPTEPFYSGRRVILVDECTQSAGEYAAMIFRAPPGAVVIGSTTAGADGNVSIIPLPGDQKALITGIAVFYPDGRPTQRVGIVPDLIVKPRIEDIAAGRDVVVETAMEIITGKPRGKSSP